MFPSSLLCAAVCYLGQDYPVSLADNSYNVEKVVMIVVMISRDVCHQIHDVLPNGKTVWIFFLLTAVRPSRGQGEIRLGINLSWQRGFPGTHEVMCLIPDTA